MDRREVNGDWPRKRIRLEHTIKSQVSYNCSIITKANTDDDRTRQGEGYGYGVYGERPPKLYPDLPDYDDVSSLNRSLDTHGHDYLVTSSMLLTQSTAARPVESAVCAISNLPRHSEVSPSNGYGGPKDVFTNEVCFGMLDTIPVEQLHYEGLDLDPLSIPVYFGHAPDILQTTDGRIVGRLNPRYTQIITSTARRRQHPIASILGPLHFSKYWS